MKNFNGIFLLFMLIIISSKLSAVAGNWTMIKDNDGIKVYERPVAGTDLMEYTGVALIDAKIEVIGEVLRDVPSYPSWLTDCSFARVIKKYDRNTLVIHIELKPPIIKGRDVVLKDKAVYDWDNGKALVTFTATEEAPIPDNKDRVRVTDMTGVFDMEYFGRDKTKFIYKLRVDPAGNIPKKFAYAVMKNYPYDTLKRLKRMAGIKKYQELSKGSYDEKQVEMNMKNEACVRRILSNRLSKFVKEKAALCSIIDADRDGIRNIIACGSTYEIIKKTTTKFYTTYFERYITNKYLAEVAEMLKKDTMMIAELTDMILNDYGDASITVDSIVAKYLNKYVK
jgi:START domain